MGTFLRGSCVYAYIAHMSLCGTPLMGQNFGQICVWPDNTWTYIYPFTCNWFNTEEHLCMCWSCPVMLEKSKLMHRVVLNKAFYYFILILKLRTSQNYWLDHINAVHFTNTGYYIIKYITTGVTTTTNEILHFRSLGNFCH